MKFSAFEKEILKSEIKPVYLLSSAEPYFLNHALILIKDLIKRGSDQETDIEIDTFDSKTASAPEIINLASTYPFLSSKRIVIVKNFDNMFKNESTKKDLLLYDSYFNDYSDFTVLLITSEKIDKRLKTISSAIKKGFVYEFDNPSDNEIPPLIKSNLKLMFKKQIDDDGALLLAELISGNLSNLEPELQKLTLYIGGKNSITADDVSKMVGNVSTVNSFKMIDALSCKDAKNAVYMLLQNLNHNQEPPEKLLGLLRWHFRRLYGAKKAIKNGTPLTQVFSDYNLFYSHQAKFKEQLNNFSLEQLSNIYYQLYQADRKMKSTGLKPNFLLEKFFYSILS